MCLSPDWMSRDCISEIQKKIQKTQSATQLQNVEWRCQVSNKYTRINLPRLSRSTEIDAGVLALYKKYVRSTRSCSSATVRHSILYSGEGSYCNIEEHQTNSIPSFIHEPQNADIWKKKKKVAERNLKSPYYNYLHGLVLSKVFVLHSKSCDMLLVVLDVQVNYSKAHCTAVKFPRLVDADRDRQREDQEY